MTVELTVTSITVQPEISAVQIVITPTFSSGGSIPAPIISISKNSVNIEPDELKNVNIEVPTKTSDLTNDSNFVSDAGYVHTDNNYDDGAVLEVAKIAYKQDATDDNLETNSNTIVGAINEVNSIAKQASNGRVFATVLALDAWLAVPANVVLLKVGDAFYIVELKVPDYWWDGTQKQELETQKVDLSQYYTSAQIDTLLGNYYTSSEIDTILSGNYYTKSEIETNFRNETQDTIGDLIELTELATVTDTTKIAASDSAFLKWVSGLKIYNYLRDKLLAATNTWALLQTFTSGLKTTKIIPDSDNTGVVIRNAADTADVVKVDTANVRFGIGTSTPATNVHIKGTTPIDLLSCPLFFETNRARFMYAESITADKKVAFGSSWGSIEDFAVFTKTVAGDFGAANTRFIVKMDGKIGISTTTPETTIDVNGKTTLRDWVYLNNGTHTGDAVGDRRCKVVSGILKTEKSTTINATRGSGTWVVEKKVLSDGSHQFGNDTNNTTIEADGTIKLNGAAKFVAPIATPASATATGRQGQVVVDSNYIYVCTATNTWKRTALTTW